MWVNMSDNRFPPCHKINPEQRQLNLRVLSMCEEVCPQHIQKRNDSLSGKPALPFTAAGFTKTRQRGVSFSVRQQTSVVCVGNGILCIHEKTKYSHFQHHGWDWKTVNEIRSSTENESPHEFHSFREQNGDQVLRAGESRTWRRECIVQWAQWLEGRDKFWSSTAQERECSSQGVAYLELSRRDFTLQCIQ